MLVIDGTQYSNWSRDLFEEMRAGGVTAVNVTLVYWENARETLSRLAEWNLRFERHGDLIVRARTMADVRHAQQTGKVAILYGLQNCSPIEDDIGLVEIFRDLGVRTMQLTYNNQSALATGCYESADSGVTRFGKTVIREMNRVGMIVDMSHSAERSTFEAIDLSARPIVISHANPTFFRAAKRNKSDEVLRALAARGGLLGFSLYPFHLRNGSQCTAAEFVDMMARTADMIGIDHIGIGTDLCQGQHLCGARMDAQRPLEQGNGLWRGQCGQRGLAGARQLVSHQRRFSEFDSCDGNGGFRRGRYSQGARRELVPTACRRRRKRAGWPDAGRSRRLNQDRCAWAGTSRLTRR